MTINIGKHEFTELWCGVLYKALSDPPRVTFRDAKRPEIIRECRACPVRRRA